MELQINGVNADGYLKIIGGTTPAKTGEIRVGNSQMTVQTTTNHPLLLGINSTEAMRINTDRTIGIGTTTAGEALLHIDQSASGAAIPALKLDQADISEEFIRFIGTAAVSDITQSVVAEASVSTATRAGFVKVYVQDDGNQITDQSYFMPVYTLS